MLGSPTHRLLGALALALLGCPNTSDDDDDTPPAPGGGGGPTLNAVDQPAVAPCPDQTILTDGALLEELKTALRQGTFVHLDVPFNASDVDIFKKKCGLEGFWNPTDNVNEVPPSQSPLRISEVLQFDNAGICATGFNNGSFGTGEGFPQPGTYRKEFKVADGGMTWHVRLRMSVAGSAAGNTFSSESLTVPAGIEGLFYEVDGTEVVHDSVFLAAIDALAAPTPGFTVEVLRTSGGTPILTVAVELICVRKS